MYLVYKINQNISILFKTQTKEIHRMNEFLDLELVKSALVQ